MSTNSTTVKAQWDYLTSDVLARIESAVESANRGKPGTSHGIDTDGTAASNETASLHSSSGLPQLAETDLADATHNVATALAFNPEASTVVQSATALRTLAAQHVLALRRERGRAMGNVQSRARGGRSDVLARAVTPRKNATPSERAALAAALTSGSFTRPAEVRQEGQWVAAPAAQSALEHSDSVAAWNLYRDGRTAHDAGLLADACRLLADAIRAVPADYNGTSAYLTERADRTTAGRADAVFAAHALAKWAPPTFRSRFRDSSHGVSLWTLRHAHDAYAVLMADLRDAAYRSVVDWSDPLTRAAWQAWRHGRQQAGVTVTRSSVNITAVTAALYGPSMTRADQERTRRALKLWARTANQEAHARQETLLVPLHGAEEDQAPGHDTGQTVRYVLDDSRQAYAAAAYRWQRQHGRDDHTAPDQWEAWASEHAAGHDNTGARSRWTGHLALTHAPASCRVPSPRAETTPDRAPYGADTHAYATYARSLAAWNRGDRVGALRTLAALSVRRDS